jgi:hypothetical protein
MIFWGLDNIYKAIQVHHEHPNFENIKALLISCLDLQPLTERIHSMLANIATWLVYYDGKLENININSEDGVLKLQEAWEVCNVYNSVYLYCQHKSPPWPITNSLLNVQQTVEQAAIPLHI